MIILDSSVWIAFFNEKDSQHKKAKDLLLSIKKEARDTVILPEYIVAETVSVLLLKSGKATVEAFLEAATDNDEAGILLSDPELFWNTLGVFRQQDGVKLSFIDVALLYLSKKYDVISFDKELEKAIKKRKYK